MDTYEKVMELVAMQFNINEDELNEDTSFIEDLHADSIDLVHLVMTLEDEYGMEVEDEEVEEIQTIGDAIEYIENNLD